MNPVLYGLPVTPAGAQLAGAFRRGAGCRLPHQPVPAVTLKSWAQQLGDWEKLVNKSSTTWRTLLPQRKNPASDPEWTLLLKEYPALVRRPVVVQDDESVSVGFTDNGFKKLFGR